jgi:hypothetical protein
MLTLQEKTENTPDITGRKSSLPAAKNLLIAVANTSAGKVTDGSSRLTALEIHHREQASAL